MLVYLHLPLYHVIRWSGEVGREGRVGILALIEHAGVGNLAI